MAEDKQVKSNRDKVRERIAKKYPDRNFDEEEEMFGAIDGDYEEYDRQIQESQGREKAFSDMFTADPRSARMMMEWKNGEDPAVALIRLYGDDITEAINDPEKQDAIKQANKEFADRVAKEKDLEKQYDANLEQSLSMLAQMSQSEGYSDEQIDGAMELIMNIAKDAMMGKFTPETLKLAMKALNYEQDMAQTAQEAEVRGRNTRIDEQLRRRGQGDGTAHLGGRNATAPGRQNPDMGALSRYDGSSKNIWERGNEKRIPMK